ncbi:MAG: hypothetical protein U9R16_03580, partial [Campylobacterota bacterium]|nr:hypothetical protein [Campylobacterota bacterium]
MKRLIYGIVVLAITTLSLEASGYNSMINNWKSHEDVANWVRDEWKFSNQDARKVANKIRKEGPQIIPAKSAEETYDNPRGWCKDAANFGIESLNKMDPKYKAKYIFIKNRKGPPHHWVTGFQKDGKIYVIDFGAGSHWGDMMGVHGPYDSLDGYRDFLSNIHHGNFELGSLDWWTSKSLKDKYSGNKRSKMLLKKFDDNKDGKISFNEAPPPMKKGFEFLDANEDGY